MAAFDVGDDLGQDLAYRLVQNSFVTLFWRREVLAEVLARLRDHGYEIVEVDAGGSLSTVALLDRFAEVLAFPAYFGRNLDALNDCLSDVAEGTYGFDPRQTGLVPAIRHFDQFAAGHPREAHAVLDIVADRSRQAALIGHRMMCLVQTDDPRLELAPVGRTPATWNPAEWLSANRGLD